MTDYQDNPVSGVCVVTGLYRETVTTIRHLATVESDHDL
jgi:hypothetical protein